MRCAHCALHELIRVFGGGAWSEASFNPSPKLSQLSVTGRQGIFRPFSCELMCISTKLLQQFGLSADNFYSLFVCHESRHGTPSSCA
jgi:hypothetical protein